VTDISEHIRDEVFSARLRRNAVLVVYDAYRRYRELCLSLACDAVAVVDASESSIEGREAASRAFVSVGRGEPGPKELLIYVPARAPVTDEERQVDPFAAYTVCGAVFPSGDGDDYLSLCLKAKPDYATEIRRLFEQDPSPSFALIDNVGGGLQWPTLRTLLQAESARDILFALLVPSPKHKEALKTNEAWVNEARALLGATLGLKLITRAKTWPPIADELWRFLLFSEFVLDLPSEPPAALSNVPRAPQAAQPLVEDLCDRLRSDARTRPTYVERAEQIEMDLDLPNHCQAVAELGVRDTFPFEERTILAASVKALEADRLDEIRGILDHHRGSVWIGKGESQAQWGLVEASLQLVECCDDAERQLADHARSLDTLIGYYVSSLCEVDRRQREFEQSTADLVSPDAAMTAVIDHTRRRYGRLIEKLGVLFTRHLDATGWPPQGRLANADVFNRFVQPLLNESGRRVAYFMVDALRYELGVALHAELAETDHAELLPACAHFPTVTPVGMASLLPAAGSGLQLAKDGEGFVAVLGGVRLVQVAQRMELLRARFGDRFAEMPLGRFLAPKQTVPANVDLLVLRSNEIDSLLESNPETTLSLIYQTLKSIRRAVHKLRELGFVDAVIATDHGFFLNAHAEAGDLCAKPPGNWVTVHDRSLLGDGAADPSNFAIAAERVGIRGDFARFAGPRTMAPYRRGLLYFHGGASLQEAVVPVITVRLRRAKQLEIAKATVVMSYKNGAKRITTRLPVVSLLVETSDMFSLHSDFEILLEAHDRKGKVVGEAKAGGIVNAATGTITLKPGQPEQVAIRMDPEYEGKFTLKALNPVTMASYATLDLETDYAV
jgi:PglZ domain